MLGFGRVLAGVAAAMVAMHCSGANEVAPESRAVSGFNQVVLHGVGELLIEQTGTESLVVEAERKVLPLLTSEVKGSVLYLDVRGPQMSTPYPVRYRLSAKTLIRIHAEGSGNVAAGKLTAEALDIRLAGASNLVVSSFEGKSLTVKMDGAGSARIGGGSVSTQTVVMDGSGNYTASKLASNETTVSVRGSGDAAVAAKDALIANVSGSGGIRYWGNPKVRADVTGAGSVERGGS
jgi:hypothetical protein